MHTFRSAEILRPLRAAVAHRPAALGAVFLLAFAVAPASAALVSFDSIAGGPWGAAFGESPGDFIFSEDGVNVHVEEYHLGGFTGFIEASIRAPFGGFGAGRILCLNNINGVFRFPNTCSVQFDFIDQGGTENIRVNGGALFEDEFTNLDGIFVTAAVQMHVAWVNTPDGKVGRVLLDGPVDAVWIGGQELCIDDVRQACAGDKQCDAVVDHETRPIGEIWGNAFGDSPGDLAFTEGGIPVHLERFDNGAFVTFNQAEIDPPIVGFGKSHIMELNNISVQYRLGGLPCPVGHLTLFFADCGGTENLRVNGGALFVGDLPTFPANPAPNVTLSVTTMSIPNTGCEWGVLRLDGPLEDVVIGGQEFWVDNVCATCEAVDVPGHELAGAGSRLAPVVNPFRAGSDVRYVLDEAGAVDVSVFDVSGSRVATLVDGVRGAGEHQTRWDGRDRNDVLAAPGTYFLRLTANGVANVQKIVLVR